MANLSEFAQRLDEAALAGVPIRQLTLETSLDAAAGYEVQRQLIGLRIARGERVVGLKMGLTSQAKMAQVGVDQPILGHLTDALRIGEGDAVALGQLIHPRVEPEIAFLLDGRSQAVAAAPALEIIDSRYADFEFTLPDVVADNTSAAGFVLGPWQELPDEVDNLGVLLEIDGRVAQTGSTAAILGDPRRSLAQGLELAAVAGIVPYEGWIFLAGAATAAVALSPGSHVRATVQSLGTASLTVAAEPRFYDERANGGIG